MIDTYVAVFREWPDCTRESDPYHTIEFTASTATPTDDLADQAFSALLAQQTDEFSVYEVSLIAVTREAPRCWVLRDGMVVPWNTEQTLVCGDANAYDAFLAYRKAHPIYVPPIPTDELPF